MANNVKTIEFNGEKLKNALIYKGYNLNDLSQELGYGRNYFTDVCRRSKLSVAGIKALELKTGISINDFIATEEKSKEIITTVNNSELFDKLETITDYLDKLLTGIVNIIEVQDRQTKYLSHIMRNTRHFESFEETMQRVKAESQTMKASEKGQ